jgi:hypothetical protein
MLAWPAVWDAGHRCLQASQVRFFARQADSLSEELLAFSA